MSLCPFNEFKTSPCKARRKREMSHNASNSIADTHGLVNESVDEMEQWCWQSDLDSFVFVFEQNEFHH